MSDQPQPFKIDAFYRICHEADAAVTRLQSALDLPYRPLGLQPVADLMDEVKRWHARMIKLEAEKSRAEQVLRAVEQWWVNEGMGKFDGAPACMFAVRECVKTPAGAEATNGDPLR
jgi:hypothetical protein